MQVDLQGCAAILQAAGYTVSEPKMQATLFASPQR
jgi:hypothetical protein